MLGLLMLCQSPNVRAPCIVTTMSLNMPHSVYIQARRHIILSGVVTLSELWSGLITYKSKENIGPHLSVNSLLVLLFSNSCVSLS